MSIDIKCIVTFNSRIEIIATPIAMLSPVLIISLNLTDLHQCTNPAPAIPSFSHSFEAAPKSMLRTTLCKKFRAKFLLSEGNNGFDGRVPCARLFTDWNCILDGKEINGVGGCESLYLHYSKSCMVHVGSHNCCHCRWMHPLIHIVEPIGFFRWHPSPPPPLQLCTEPHFDTHRMCDEPCKIPCATILVIETIIYSCFVNNEIHQFVPGNGGMAWQSHLTRIDSDESAQDM